MTFLTLNYIYILNQLVEFYKNISSKVPALIGHHLPDFVTEKDQNLIIDLFIRGRKKNTSIVYMTQRYFSTPQDIRLQCNYFVFFNISNHRKVLEIQKDHCSGIDKDTFLSYFYEATKEPLNFFMIDKKTTKKSLAYKKNLDKTLAV